MTEKTYIITASLVIFKPRKEDFVNVLKSVRNSCIDKLYIIDNSPTNQAQKWLEELNYKKSKYIFGHGNVGFGNGNNIALREVLKSDSKYHIILNPDIIFQPHVIDQLCNYMEGHRSVGMILPKVTYPDGRLQRLCKLLPTPIDIFARRFFSKKWMKKRNDKYEMYYTGYDKIWNCPILSGCFMFLRTSVLKEVGVFDPRFFMYFEDFDLMRRIHQVSETIFFPYVSIIHNHAAEHRHNKRLLIESLKSAIKYFNKWGWIWDSERKRVNKSALTPQIKE